MRAILSDHPLLQLQTQIASGGLMEIILADVLKESRLAPANLSCRTAAGVAAGDQGAPKSTDVGQAAHQYLRSDQCGSPAQILVSARRRQDGEPHDPDQGILAIHDAYEKNYSASYGVNPELRQMGIVDIQRERLVFRRPGSIPIIWHRRQGSDK